MSRTRPPLLPYAVLALGLAGIALSAIFVKWANLPGAVSGFYRMAIAAGVMGIPFGLHVRRRPPASARHVLYAIVAGLFFACDLATWNTAILIGNAANATLFGNTSPLWVGIGAMLLFKERLRPLFWGGVLIALAGAAVILGRDFLVHPTLGRADMLGLLAGFFYGMFFLATERARDALSALSSWWISVATSSIALLAVSLLLREPLTGYSTGAYLNLIALALIVQVFGWLSINYALGHLPASVVSPTLLGQPVITAIAAVPLLGQPLSGAQITGGLIVLAGIFVVHRSKQ